MAFDAGSIESRLIIHTAEASADLDKIEARVRALESSPHIITISAVFDDASIGKARRAFQLLDNAISYDAMQRLRSSPQGSVLGALNALFSPHPVTGGPSPQQAAAKGLLGQMFSAQGGGSTTVPGAQGGGNVLRDVVTGNTRPQQVTVTQAGGGGSGQAARDLEDAAADGKAAAAAQTAAAGSTSDAAGSLKDAAAGLKASAAAGAVSGLQKMMSGQGGAGAAAAGAGAAAAGSPGQGGGGNGSAAANLLGLAAAATTAAQAAQYASAAQKVFTGTETDVAAAAKNAAAQLGAMAAASTSSGDASRYAYAVQVAQSLAAKALGASAGSAGKAMSGAGTSTGLFNDYLTRGLPLWSGTANAVGFLKGHLQLFAGALTSVGLPAIIGTVSGLHLAAEAVIETAGTLIPAAIAFTAFGVAAAPTVKDLFQQMNSLYTVTQAYQTELYPLTGSFDKVAQAVKPEVYTLFGEALVFASHNTGAFQQLATGAGSVLDQLGARFVYATTQSSTFSQFTSKATQDLSIWGNNLGNLGGIIGGVLKVLPGYAQVIGNVFGTVTHDVEDLVNSGIGQWFLRVGLLAHGGLIYVGLFGTALAKLASVGLSGVASGLLSAAVRVSKLGSAGAVAGDGLMSLAAGAETAAALPWGWISIAAAGVGFLVYQLVSAKSAAQQFADGVQQRILNGPLQNLGSTLKTTLTDSIDSAHQAYYDYLILLGQTQYFNTAIDKTRQQNQAVQDAAQKYADYRAVIQAARGDQAVYNANLKTAAAVFGGTQAALSAFTAAGISSSDFMTTSKQKFAQLIIEAQGYDAAIRAVTRSQGRYGAAQNALNFTAGDSVNTLGQVVASMQKVTQAEDAVLSTLLGGEQAFTAYAQGLAQMGADAKVSGASLNGLNAQSLTLANDFYSTVLPAAQKQIDALQNQDISTSDLTKVIATLAGQTLTYAGNNTAAKVAVIDLINNALGPGTVSLQSVDKWVGRNSTSMLGYKAIVDKTAIAASNLAGVLAQNLNAMFAQDLLQSSGAATAMKKYTDALVSSGERSRAYRSARQQLITDLENAGYSARQATQYVDGLQRKIDAMHGKSVNVSVHAAGSGGIAIGTQGLSSNMVDQILLRGLAAGGLVGGTTGTRGPDDRLAMVRTGEFVVNPAATAQYLPLLQHLNSYAAGGLVGLAPGTAQDVGGFAAQMMTGDTRAVVRQLAAAVRQAQQAAIAAVLPGGGNGLPLGNGPLSGSAALAQSFARSIMFAYGWTQAQWPYLQALWQRESGWNAYALNPASGAAGIPQNINGWAAYRPGDYQAQDRWGEAYISGRYGTPQNAYGHEIAFGWYDKGGVLPPGVTVAFNSTGAPEVVLSPDQVSVLAGEGSKGRGPLVTIGTVQLPEGATVTKMAQEIDFYLRAAQTQGYANVRP